MAEEIRELIEKIRQDGIQAAEESAKRIEEEAYAKARSILDSARAESKKMLEEARLSIGRHEASSVSSLKQAARDVLIGLKKEITATLDKLVLADVKRSLGPGESAKMIAAILNKRLSADKGGIIISFNREDSAGLEEALKAELSAELKKGIVLKPSEDIKGGFTISYDNGKSYFDFTDKALADYIAAYIRPKLSEYLGE